MNPRKRRLKRKLQMEQRNYSLQETIVEFNGWSGPLTIDTSTGLPVKAIDVTHQLSITELRKLENEQSEKGIEFEIKIGEDEPKVTRLNNLKKGKNKK